MTRHDGNGLKIVTTLRGGWEGGGDSLSTRTRTPRGCITPSHTHTHTCPHTEVLLHLVEAESFIHTVVSHSGMDSLTHFAGLK